MRKEMYDIMKRNVEADLTGIPLDALSVSTGESVNKETGEVKPYVRVDVEVPKGNGPYSRCQFSVKVPGGKMLVTDEDLETNDYTVIFENLQISYMDAKGNVYFRADSYSIEKEG